MPELDYNDRARAELRAMGATFRRCVDGTRHLTARTSYQPWPPNGNALVRLPGDLIVFDADSPQAVAELQYLFELQAATLIVTTTRGVHRYYRLPTGVTLRAQNSAFRRNSKIDVLDNVVAPGSEVAGTVYQSNGLPIVTMTRDLAEALRSELGERKSAHACSDPSEARYVVGDGLGPYSADGRRQLAREAKQRRRPRPSAERARQRCHELAQLATDGGRHRNLWQIGLLHHENGWGFEAFYELVRSEPIRSKLLEKGRGDRAWLDRMWSKIISQTRPEGHDKIAELDEAGQRARYGAPELAEDWRRVALPLAVASGTTALVREQLAKLVYLHASFCARYGQRHQLSTRMRGDFLGRRGRVVNQRRDQLTALGVLASVRRGALGHAEMFELVMPAQPPSPCSSSFGPPTDGALFEPSRVHSIQSLDDATLETVERWLARPLMSDEEIVGLRARTDALNLQEDERRPRRSFHTAAGAS